MFFFSVLKVSWVRRFYDASTVETSELQLLTVGMHTYTGDLRYSVDFESPNNWRLKIQSVVKRDEGFYECQVCCFCFLNTLADIIFMFRCI